MRSIITTLAFIILSSAVMAQEDVFSNKTNIALEKVVKDFPNRFHNIKGDVIVQQAQTVEYKSTVQVPGATSCVVTKHVISNNDSYTWSCTAFTSRDFNIAKNKYKEIYDQIANTIIKVDGQKPFIISGQYRTPYEQRKLTAVVFELLPAVGEMKKLKIELDLQYVVSDWKVTLNVYDNDHKEEQATASTN
ncbi:MAG: hypothetical protein JST75_03055 [Bacteroidetes bacterium]|nr:hypothetical protein [Bacteroidota bacterium]